MKNKIAVVLGALLSLVGVFAQTSTVTAAPVEFPPGTTYAERASATGLPIRNLAVLRAYVEASTKQGSLSINHPGIIPNRYVSQQIGVTPNANANYVINWLMTGKLVFDLGSVEGSVDVNVNLNSESGHQTFYGYLGTHWEIARGGDYWLPSGASVKLNMVPVPPIKVPGLVRARGVFRDSRGNVSFDGGLRVENQHLMYPTNMVERAGEVYLTVQENDGSHSTVVIDASTGGAKTLERGVGTVGLHIEGDYNFGVNPPSVEVFGSALRTALVRFEVEAPPASSWNFAIGGKSNSGEVPVGIVLRNTSAPEDGPWVFYPIVEGRGIIALFSGQYELAYIMTPADLDGVPIVPPGYYGYPDNGAVKGSEEPAQL